MPELDPYLPGDAAFIRDPYPFYDRLRSEDPVHWSEAEHSWLVSRYGDVLDGVRDARLSARRMPALLAHVELPADHRALFLQRSAAQMISADSPEHGRLRGLASRAFTPRTMAGIRPRVAQIAASLLDRALAGERMDVVAEFAYPLPMTVIGELLGIPAGDYVRVKGWADDIAGFMSSGHVASDEVAGYLSAWDELAGYVRTLAARRRFSDEDDDIVGLLLRHQQAGNATEEEVVANLVLFAVAGHETTTNTISLGIWSLLQNQDQLARLYADPELIPSAVEEILRYEPTSQRTMRVASEDITMGDRKIAAGQLIVFLLGAANRDPAAFPEPARFDIGRQPNRHLAFSQGVHFCLGAPLARLELQEAIGAFIRRTRGLTLKAAEPGWRQNVRMRGVTDLDLAFRPA